jgi:hypothetical protein
MTRSAISFDVATGYAVSPPKKRMSPRGAIRIRQLVGRKDQARHRAAHLDVVAGVGHEVDVDVAPQRLDQVRGRGIAAEDRGDAPHQLARIVRGHPVSRIDALAGDGRGDEVTQVAPE